MAGDWIKMRSNLWDDPRVARLCDLTDQAEAAVVGGLYWLWAMADQHTEDGLLPGMSLRQLDRKTGVPGLGSALCEIGWLEESDAGLRIVRFEDHNGSSAKRRSLDASRKASSRASSTEHPAAVRVVSASDADKTATPCGARERVREEIDTSPGGDVERASRAPQARPSRKCPATFAVTDELRQWAAQEFPGLNVDAETATFRDHTFATARTDWAGTWRNWMRKASGYARASPPAAASKQAALEARNREVAQRWARQQDQGVIDAAA